MQERLARGIANGLSLSSDEDDNDDVEATGEDEESDTKVVRRRSGIELIPCRTPSDTSLPFRKFSDGFGGGLGGEIGFMGSDSALIIKDKPPLPQQKSQRGAKKSKKTKNRHLF